jgi:collagenase-like PrtC family protease
VVRRRCRCRRAALHARRGLAAPPCRRRRCRLRQRGVRFRGALARAAPPHTPALPPSRARATGACRDSGRCSRRRRSCFAKADSAPPNHLRPPPPPPPSLLLRSAGDAPELRKNPTLYAEAAPSTSAAGSALRKPQVLAPAGGWAQLRAAVACGADAVYFGLDAFNARARAENFTLAELPALMAELHASGVKGFVAMNILLYDTELSQVETYARAMAAAGVDAVIVQDVGAVRLLRRLAPGLPVHASTQMSVTSPEGARFAASLGVARVVAGRELSVRELRAVAAGAGAGVDVEAFVHGALCVSYSGQCLSSEAWGGRSANRGQCAQACRLPYGLLVDGTLASLGDVSYILSPQDLCGLGHVPALMAAGVHCFKIEGRLKGPEYVAATTSAYRKAVDDAWEALSAAERDASSGVVSASIAAAVASAPPPSEGVLRDLAQVFARGQDEEHGGLTPGFLDGVSHQSLVRGRAPRHRGVLLGTVVSVTRRGVAVALHGGAVVRRGVGVVFDRGKARTRVFALFTFTLSFTHSYIHRTHRTHRTRTAQPEEREEGGSVYEVYDTASGARLEAGEEAVSGTVELCFGRGDVDARRVAAGQRVWRTRDPALEARLRAAASAPPPPRRVAASAAGGLDEPLTLTLTSLDVCDPRTGALLSASAATASALAPARARSLTAADVAREVGSLAGAGLTCVGDVDTSALLRLGAALFLPAGEIKRARQAAASALAAAIAAATAAHARDDGLASEAVLAPMLAEARAALASSAADADADADVADADVSDAAQPRAPRIRVLCRTPAQVRAALRVPWLAEVTLDFLEVQGLAAEVAAVRAAGRRAVVATPRVLKPDEERLWQFYLRLNADALLVRSIGLLHQLQALGGAGASVALPSGATVRVPALHGDFSLNAANTLAAAHMLASSGLARLTPAHDLSAPQLAALARSVGPRAASRLEVVIHQHLPIFHTEHCVFARHLSTGSSFKDCGHPCERHALHLRAPDGASHAVLADMGCRNTVFNGAAQSGGEYVPMLAASGVGGLRVELLEEGPDDVAPLLEAYRTLSEAAAAGGNGNDAQGAGVAEALAAIVRLAGVQGVTKGSLDGGRKEAARGDMKPTAAAGRAR